MKEKRLLLVVESEKEKRDETPDKRVRKSKSQILQKQGVGSSVGKTFSLTKIDFKKKHTLHLINLNST